VRVFFDVHGTLLSTDERQVRPGTSDLLQWLAEQGHEVTLWSTAGSGYARAFAQRFRLLPWVFETLSKRENARAPDVCVDDHPDYLVGRVGNIQVSAFRGDPHDRELDRVREAIQAL
jgi:phosphoglycolate phosphatase-like HAD superfamily hydrolase